MFTKIDHVGIAVADMEKAIATYRQAAGAELIEREASPDGSMEIAMLRLGDDMVELLAPRQGESVIKKFIEKKGEGLHHVAYAVADIDAELARLKEAGYQLVDEKARPGAMNSRIAFLHPKSTLGALWELVEPAEEHT